MSKVRHVLLFLMCFDCAYVNFEVHTPSPPTAAINPFRALTSQREAKRIFHLRLGQLLCICLNVFVYFLCFSYFIKLQNFIQNTKKYKDDKFKDFEHIHNNFNVKKIKIYTKCTGNRNNDSRAPWGCTFGVLKNKGDASLGSCTPSTTRREKSISKKASGAQWSHNRRNCFYKLFCVFFTVF